ncbi:unnamed protein product [Anisakis simplex]|uniref:Uncharacterized protein n=1 Tax=Anisakis simplex TaxID=6269 RepID=A0A3P6T3V8_ANISI|nr:unnamed protein product [Anisakis simplex]
MNVSLAEYKELFPRGSGKMPEKKIGRRLSKKGLRQRLQADFRMLDAAITTDLPMRNWFVSFYSCCLSAVVSLFQNKCEYYIPLVLFIISIKFCFSSAVSKMN